MIIPAVKRGHREARNGHQGVILWFTGLSGAGKSTLAYAVEEALFDRHCHTFVFDGDNVRQGLCGDLGFSDMDREENIRRIGEVAILATHAGVIALTAFISPFRRDRDAVRQRVPKGEFIEIYCDADLAICENRDVKGLYKKARAGDISDFTGITSIYEEPHNPELAVNTGKDNIASCAAQVVDYLVSKGVIIS